VITARAEVESAKLMRRAADILSSAPAMQIRYLEAMQAMAKSASSKVIFLPATNQTVQEQMSVIAVESPESQIHTPPPTFGSEDRMSNPSFQSAINANIIEHM